MGYFTSEEIFIVSILTKLEKDIIPKGNVEQKAICLFVRLESIDFILSCFPMLIYSTILRIDFLDPFII